MSLLGNAMSTDCDYYSTLLGIRIDTDGQVIKMNAQLRIRQLMEERGWTDYRLAKEANLSHSTVRNLFKRNSLLNNIINKIFINKFLNDIDFSNKLTYTKNADKDICIAVRLSIKTIV